MRKLPTPRRRTSALACCGVLALLSTPALADSGWDEVGAFLVGVTCLILIIATVVTINATGRVALVLAMVAAGSMSWLLASEAVTSELDIWTFFLACFVVLTVACAGKLWRKGRDRETPPPP